MPLARPTQWRQSNPASSGLGDLPENPLWSPRSYGRRVASSSQPKLKTCVLLPLRCVFCDPAIFPVLSKALFWGGVGPVASPTVFARKGDVCEPRAPRIASYFNGFRLLLGSVLIQLGDVGGNQSRVNKGLPMTALTQDNISLNLVGIGIARQRLWPIHLNHQRDIILC